MEGVAGDGGGVVMHKSDERLFLLMFFSIIVLVY